VEQYYLTILRPPCLSF